MRYVSLQAKEVKMSSATTNNGWMEGGREGKREGGRVLKARKRTRGGELVDGNTGPAADDLGDALLVHHLSDHA
jgi:hypothetical protein